MVPFYWILISIAAWKGFLQLIQPGKAHYWEKTQHGLSNHSGHGDGAGPQAPPEIADTPDAADSVA